VQPVLTAGAVHLWRFSLNAAPSFAQVLSSEEQTRAQRLKAPEKARSFAVARTRLRQILGGYLNLPPEVLRFAYGANGKPALAAELDTGIQFNLSHSGDWGLCALTLGGAIGVDLEQVSPTLEFLPLAQRFFSCAEINWLNSWPQGRRRRAFYRLWTRKEAWLKGHGDGFSSPTLALDSRHLATTITTAHDWTLLNLLARRGYVAALALQGCPNQLLRLNWPED